MKNLAVPLLSLVGILGLAAASHCTGYSTSTPDAQFTAGAKHYYMTIDCAPIVDGCLEAIFLLIFVYEESNDLIGLQRDDEFTDDTCHGQIDGDTIVF